MDKTSSNTEYFAALPGADLAKDLESKAQEWTNDVVSSGFKDRWVKSYRYYYGRHFIGQNVDGSLQGSDILKAGKEGELTLLSINHYRNLIKHILVMTTNQKPAFDVRAMNSDNKSLQQAKLANAILDGYLREKRLGRYLKLAAEQALVFGKGFIKCVWEPSLGEPYTTQAVPGPDGQVRQKIVYEGDVEISCPSPFDVFVDQSLEDWSKAQWVMVREFKNKFDLAATYPQLSQKIIDLPTKGELDRSRYLTFQKINETADVPVWSFYHKKSKALPNGRYMVFCNDETVLYDGPIPYEKLPVFRITPGEIFGSTEGYTDAFDILSVQEAFNTLVSAVFSNQNAFAVQNVLVPRGCNISAEMISDGLRVMEYDPQAGVPTALQLTSSPKEVFDFIQMLEKWSEILSGVNAVARGNPEAQMGKNSSGTALALIQSMAIQYASGFQQSWAELLEDSGTFILDLLKDFANTKRMVTMAGKHNRGNMTAFTKDDLRNISRVVVDLGNPMARTTAGRVSMADSLLQNGQVKTPQEYVNVIETGNLEPMLEGPDAQISLVRQENEALMDGKPVKALVGDGHVLHMQEHYTVVSDPDLRSRAAAGDPQATQIVSNTLSHIQEHMQLYTTQPPLFSMVAGEPPAPQPQGPPAPPPGPPQAPQHPQPGQPQKPQGSPQPMPPQGAPSQPLPPAGRPGPAGGP